jgi:rod shape determining protein RodA
MSNFISKISKTWDYLLYFAVILLVVLGIVLIYSISIGGEKNLAVQQGLFFGIGLAGMLIFSFIDYRALGAASVSMYVVGVVLLALLLIPGIGTNIAGSTRWINLGFFQFQPSELMKLIMIVVLARYYGTKVGSVELKHIMTGILITGLPTLLTLLEPDLGSALVLVAIFIVILISSRITTKHLLSFGAITLILIPIFWLFVLQDYQKERLTTFANPGANPFGSGYNILQSMIATGSGGLWGRGLGHGPQSQLSFLPVQQSDFIFGVTAEQLGFVGAIVMLGFYVIILSRIMYISSLAKDSFGSLLAIGSGGLFLFQILVNTGMNLGIMPVTGITLPFVSYGGSSLIINLTLIGILQSVYMRHKSIKFD